MKNQNRDIRHTIEDILMFSLKKIYSGCTSNGPHSNCFERYYEYCLKEVGKRIVKYHPIGYSLIPLILTKDLERYFDSQKNNNSNINLKDELLKIIHETWLDAVKLTHSTLDTLRLSEFYRSADDNFSLDAESKLFEGIMIFITELFKTNLLHLDCNKLYETFVTKTGINSSCSKFSHSTMLLWDKFLNALDSIISKQITCYCEFMFCVGRIDSSFKSSVRLSLVSLGYMLKICKKLLREYKENITKINKNLRLIYNIIFFSVIVNYLYGISRCLENIISLSKWYKIKDESMEKIIKIFTNILRDCYKTMFVGKNKIWPKDKVYKDIYLKFCEIGISLTIRLEMFCKEYFTAENKYDKYKNLRYLESIAGIACVMGQVLRTIKKS